MSTRTRRKLESRLIEGLTLLGAAAGLALPVSHQPAVHGVDSSLVAAVEPYWVHALVGAACGLAVAVLLIWAGRRRRAAPSKGPVRAAIPQRVRHEVWRRDRARCVDCGSRARLEFDHIIPVSKGGSNTARNLELRCEGCNRHKGARI
jgi:HNH endonuclease